MKKLFFICVFISFSTLIKSQDTLIFKGKIFTPIFLIDIQRFRFEELVCYDFWFHGGFETFWLPIDEHFNYLPYSKKCLFISKTYYSGLRLDKDFVIENNWDSFELPSIHKREITHDSPVFESYELTVGNIFKNYCNCDKVHFYILDVEFKYIYLGAYKWDIFNFNGKSTKDLLFFRHKTPVYLITEIMYMKPYKPKQSTNPYLIKYTERSDSLYNNYFTFIKKDSSEIEGRFTQYYIPDYQNQYAGGGSFVETKQFLILDYAPPPLKDTIIYTYNEQHPDKIYLKMKNRWGEPIIPYPKITIFDSLNNKTNYRPNIASHPLWDIEFPYDSLNFITIRIKFMSDNNEYEIKIPNNINEITIVKNMKHDKIIYFDEKVKLRKLKNGNILKCKNKNTFKILEKANL